MTNISNADASRLVTASRLALNNALSSSAIMVLLSEEGYDEAELKQGHALADSLEAAISAAAIGLGAQKQATTTTVSALKEARRTIGLFRDKGRQCFAGPGNEKAWEALQLGKAVPRDMNTFITFAYQGVHAALSDASILTVLSAKKYDEAKLLGIMAKVEVADAENRSQEQRKGLKQGGTGARDQAEKGLLKWWTPFKKTARKLLSEDQLKMLEL